MKKNIISYLTIAISLFALIVSVKSCNIANQSLKLSKSEYSDKFKTILECTYIEDEKVFKLTPSNENVQLQKATVFYPYDISEIEWNVILPENYLHMTSPILNIQQMLKKDIPIKEGFSQVLDVSRIPVVIESYYTYNGDNFYDKSLYAIEFMASVSDDIYDMPYLDIQGLVFNERLDVDTNPKEYLSIIWNDETTRIEN